MEMIDNPNVDRLTFEDKEIILVGTAHVSKESAELVETVIREEQPDTVCVELCQSRYQSIRQKDKWRDMDILNIIREKKASLLLSHLILASFQKRIAEKLDMRPGEEMVRAMDTAEEIGSHIHLADREIRVTLLRTWRTVGIWDKMKIMFQLLVALLGGMEEIDEAEIEKMKQADVLETLLADVGKAFPRLRAILIDERDQYLAHRIRTAPGRKIVAVVGAGHVPGIKAGWEEQADIPSLETIPPAGKIAKTLKWFIPSAIVVLFVVGFFYGGSDKGADMVVLWVLANGVLAGLGAIIALAHPMTIVSSVIAAPLTSLNPMIAAGWVSGLVEAFSRKPKVIDFENLTEDIATLKGFWKNKVTRILLVVFFTNLGSMAGTFVAIPLMVRVLN